MEKQKKIYAMIILLSILMSVFSSLLVFTIAYRSKFLTDEGGVLQKTRRPDDGNAQIDEKSAQRGVANMKDLETSVKLISSKISPSVVSIMISKNVQNYITDPFGLFRQPSGTVSKQKVGGGTGFFINKKGVILTNKHVVSDPNAEYSIMTSTNEEYVGKILAIDPTTDLAVLKAYTKDGKEVLDTKPVKFIKSTKNIDVGNFVIAIGNALAEFQNTVTFGVISGLGRDIEAGDQNGLGTEQLTGLLQTDAAINPGNSGGPLVNLDSEVIGINTAIAAGANGLGFSIPLSQKEINYTLSSIEKYGKIKRPFIGIRYISLNENTAKILGLKQSYGDYIGSSDGLDAVIAGSPADKAGLKTGDIVLEVDGKQLQIGLSTKDIIKEKYPGDIVRLKVLTASGNTKEIEVTLGSN